MKLRAVGRLFWFLWELVVVLLDYLGTTAFSRPPSKRLNQARWLHRSCIRHLRVFGCRSEFDGMPPTRGLLVLNHLSYLDILVLSAITPAVFVSKSEVRHWPLFGWLSTLGGTLFIQRARRTHVGVVNQEIRQALEEGLLVVVFPEGTSTNGEEVLPFRSPLLEPVAEGGHPITVGRIRYLLDDGDASREVCYWGNHTFLTHALHLMGKRLIHARVGFAPFPPGHRDRKALAVELREAVLALTPP